MSNPMPQGYYTHPNDDSLGFWWDGAGNMTEPFSKAALIAHRTANGEPVPVFWNTNYPGKEVSTEVVAEEQAPALEPQWFKLDFPNHPSAPMMMRYYDGSVVSEFFDGRTVVDNVMMPEFYRQGGSKEWEANGFPVNCADSALFKLVWDRVTPDQARAVIGEDAVPMYNNGPTWIADEDNPNLARWWDGSDFTEETEFIGVIQQRAFDAESEIAATVSYAPGLAGSEAGTWQIDPSDPTQLIRWGGQRWDQRKSLSSAIGELFDDLGEPVPELWFGAQSMSPRHADLMDQLSARKNGVNGWYKEPDRFDDLRMRVWHDGQWTDQTSQQVPGLYDDPFNDELLREWSVNGWTDKTVTKEAERVRIEREALRQEKRQAFKEKVLVAVADHYSPENMRQRRIDNENDRSRRLRDAAAAASLEHHQGANNYYAQKDFDRMWRGKR